MTEQQASEDQEPAKPAKKPREKGKVSQAADRFYAGWSRGIWWVLRKTLYLLLGFAVLSCLWVALFRYANPYLTYYYVAERTRLGQVDRDWTALAEFSPYVARSVVAAEDAMFCSHFGFDVAAIKSAFNDKQRRRGGSTLSQQVAKNVFLWQGRTWVRKGLEVWFTLLVELFWSKQRIVEVYLNVAEFDTGVFGAAMAGRSYFGVEPENLTALQAARLAMVLPNPKKWSAAAPTNSQRKRTRQIIAGAATINADGRADCFQ